MRDHKSIHPKRTATGHPGPRNLDRNGIQVNWSEETIMKIKIVNHHVEMTAKVGRDHLIPNCGEGRVAFLALLLTSPMTFALSSGRQVA
jgi:hypothetical protein